MLARILHIEDDRALRAVVQLAFEGFGFRGSTVAVGTVAEAIKRLDAAAHDGVTYDLILCDMSLPDGTGLDVVRYVRSSEVWRTTPLLILSSDVNPKMVSRAYALGANAYVDKSPPGRTLPAVMKSLYEHWGKDVLLPRAHLSAQVQGLFSTAIALRSRHALLYQRLAERFGDSRSESAFWLSRSLAESNLINLLGFIRRQADGIELLEGSAAELTQMQAATAHALSAAERSVDKSSITRTEVYRCIVEVISQLNVDVLARIISELFPAQPVAMEALRDFLLGTVEDVAAWVDLHTDDQTLREKAAQLRGRIAPLEQAAMAHH